MKASGSNDSWEVNVAHARAAYANTQEIIRFIDTKTSVLTGIVTVTTGVPLVMFKYALTRNSAEAAPVISWYNHAPQFSKDLVFAAAIPLAVAFVFGLFSLLASTNGLMSRPTRNWRDKQEGLWVELGRILLRTLTLGLFGKRKVTTASHTCLFPLFDNSGAAEAHRNFARLAGSQYTRSDVLAEYAAQLEAVGGIMNIKINRNRAAVFWFERQMFAYLLCVALAVTAFLWPNAPVSGLGAHPAASPAIAAQPSVSPSPAYTPTPPP
ncbi:MAG: hypothetical protein ACJ8NS_05750 [Chthoniobacterales bacterium]